MQNADPTLLRHRDSEPGFGHRIHCRRQQGNIEAHQLRELGRDVRLTRHHVGRTGHEQHVVKGKRDPRNRAPIGSKSCGLLQILGGDTFGPPRAEHCRAVYSTKVERLEAARPASNGDAGNPHEPQEKKLPRRVISLSCKAARVPLRGFKASMRFVYRFEKLMADARLRSAPRLFIG